jgi:hypothetical protein
VLKRPASPYRPGQRTREWLKIRNFRADAIRWALARIRERPAFERLRERIREIDRLRNEF